MKRLFWPCLILLFCSFMVANSQYGVKENSGFTLKGKVSGVKDGTMIYLIENSSKDTVSRAAIKKGMFTLTGKVKEGTEYFYLRIDNAVSSKRSQEFLLVNKKLSLTGDIGKWPILRLDGSSPNDDYKSFVALWEELSQPITTTKKSLNDVVRNINLSKRDNNEYVLVSLQAKKDSIEGLIKTKESERLSGVRKFIETHAYSLYVPDIIRRIEGFSHSERENMYQKLTPDAQQSHFGKQLKADINLAKMQELVRAGAIIPQFNVLPIGQSEQSILTIAAKNKLTLIDFWASWCKPCREQIPNLKKVYAAFHHKGLEVLGIALNDREPDWKKAMEKEAIPWLNARDADLHIAKIFHVPAIPGYLLIDQHGKLISFYCSGSEIPSFGPAIKGEQLYNTIDSLLKNM